MARNLEREILGLSRQEGAAQLLGGGEMSGHQTQKSEQDQPQQQERHCFGVFAFGCHRQGGGDEQVELLFGAQNLGRAKDRELGLRQQSRAGPGLWSHG